MKKAVTWQISTIGEGDQEIGAWDGSPESQGDSGNNGGDGAEVLQDAKVQEAIRRAVLQERQRVQEEAEKSVQGLKSNRDQILEEKRRYAELGSPEDIAERLRRARDLEFKMQAQEKGHDPDKLKAEAERIAAEQVREVTRQNSEVDKARMSRIAELEGELKAAREAHHREFVRAEVIGSQIPDNYRIFARGAEDVLIDALAPHVVQREVEGFPRPVARLQINDALIPSTNTPDGFMDIREGLDRIRNPGERPLLHRDLSFAFASNGSGSGTKAPGDSGRGVSLTSKPYSKMTNAEKVALMKEVGRDGVIRHAAAELTSRAE